MTTDNLERKRNIKAIVTDIDGSLTDEKRRLSTKATMAIRSLEKEGIPVMLASGNVLPIAFGLSSFIGTSGPVIAENGGVVYHNYEVKYLADRKKCDEAYDMLRNHIPAKKLFTDRWRKTEVAIQSDVDLSEVRRLLVNHNLKVETTGFAIHIFEPHVGKFQGLLTACEILRIHVRDVAAFGDSENDGEMIKNCGVGIAPANAIPEVKSVADFVTAGSDGEGFVEGMRWLGFSDLV